MFHRKWESKKFGLAVGFEGRFRFPPVLGCPEPLALYGSRSRLSARVGSMNGRKGFGPFGPPRGVVEGGVRRPVCRP